MCPQQPMPPLRAKKRKLIGPVGMRNKKLRVTLSRKALHGSSLRRSEAMTTRFGSHGVFSENWVIGACSNQLTHQNPVCQRAGA